MNRPQKNFFIAFMAFAALGLLFSAYSTHDFLAHLDRQIHAIACSYIPFVGAPDASGSSGCHTVLMSPYSSLFRSTTWGGLPIALPALAVFAYLLFRASDIWVRKEEGDPDETRFLLAAATLPLLMSLVYFGISTLLIGAVCKLCVGVYLSSIGVFVSALLAHRTTSQMAGTERSALIPWSRYAIYFIEGVIFVLIPVVLYAALKPAYTRAMGQCGELLHPDDKYGIRVPLNANPEGVPAIELFDPLCPACKGFSQRLTASGLDKRLKLEAVMFPLDKQCNWMIGESLHPGACAVSEAVLCAGAQPQEVVDWAFANQEELRELAKEDQARLYARIKAQFPRLAGCVGSPAVKARLNKSLRWAVSNSLPVLTPQLYIRGRKVCDEDTDLGLEYVLTRLLDDPTSFDVSASADSATKPGNPAASSAGSPNGSTSSAPEAR